MISRIDHVSLAVKDYGAAKEFFEKIALSIIRCGDDSNVKYKEIYVGYKSEWIPKGYVGCSMVCAPYVVLAKNAVPKGTAPSHMLNMTVDEWESAVISNKAE